MVVEALPSPGEPAPRKRGRRAGISRETVLQAALDVAAKNPAGPVSLNAVARALHVTPMAIYTYFASRDELMQALTAALLDGLVIDVPDDATPVRKIEVWADSFREYFIERPQLITMLSWDNGHTSIAWINQSKILMEALESLGLEGAELGETLLWIWSVVMGAIYAELLYKQSPYGVQDWEFENLDPAMRRGVLFIREVVEAPNHHAHCFKFQVARLTDAIERWGGERVSRQTSRTAG
jgi:AcrR family transcriptional regulator